MRLTAQISTPDPFVSFVPFVPFVSFVLISSQAEETDQTACKPGSVRPGRSPDVTVIPLDRPLPDGSRDLPGPLGR